MTIETKTISSMKSYYGNITKNTDLKFDFTQIHCDDDVTKDELKETEQSFDYKNKIVDNMDNEDREFMMFGFRPVEVYERNLLRAQQAKQQIDKEKVNEADNQKNNKFEQSSNLIINANNLAPRSTMEYDNNLNENFLQLPTVIMPSMEKPPENIYTSENITIIDTDAQERSSSEELPGEASDVLSAISNEECSVTSEILDKALNDSLSQPINIADIIQDLECDRIGHIDSPETSDTTEGLHGESLMDDISSVLGIFFHKFHFYV